MREADELSDQGELPVPKMPKAEPSSQAVNEGLMVGVIIVHRCTTADRAEQEEVRALRREVERLKKGQKRGSGKEKEIIELD